MNDDARIMVIVRQIRGRLDEEREFLGFSDDWAVALDNIGARADDVVGVRVSVVASDGLFQWEPPIVVVSIYERVA